MDIYLVGGALRDELLGFPVAEQDFVVVGATPQQMLDQGYRQVGKDFPVFIHPKTGEEYALARTERKTGHGYTGFTCYAAPDVSLEQDLLRRDLTINAMAKSLDGRLVDPYGGERDLQQRVLRHVSQAFVEDPLRVLRLARFAAKLYPLGFRIAEETKQLILAMVREGELSALVPDRVWLELEKALATSAPQRFIEVLRECGALAVLFPEIDALFGVPNPVVWHPEIDSGVHTLMALAQATALTEDKSVRFATLVHDVGKALTPMSIWPRHIGHGERGLDAITSLTQRYPMPKAYVELARIVSRFHITCHKAFEKSAIELFALLKGMDAWRRPERFAHALLVCQADARGRTGHEKEDYPQAQLLLKLRQLTADVDIASLQAEGLSGQAIGKALEKKRLAIIEHYLKTPQ